MNIALKQALAAFALTSFAALVQAQVPANCQRISGEETPVPPDGYEADGTPVFCAKAAGAVAAPAPGYADPYAQQPGGTAPPAAPQASGGWNGRLNTPLPGSQKPGGYSGGAAGGSMGGSFQGHAANPSGGVRQGLGQSSRYGQTGQPGGYGQSAYGQGQSGYGQSQPSYGQGQAGTSPYGSTGSQGYDPYAAPSGSGSYDPYAGQAGATTGAYGSATGQPPPAAPGGYDPYAGQTGSAPPTGYDPYAGQTPTATPGTDNAYGTPAPTGDASPQGPYGGGSASGAGSAAGSSGAPATGSSGRGIQLPKPVADRLPPAGSGSEVTGSGRVAIPATPVAPTTVPKLPSGNKVPRTLVQPAAPKPAPGIRHPGS